MLRNHIAEVSASMESAVDAVSADGKSMTRPQRGEYLRTLLAERDKLESKASTARAGGQSYWRAGRPGPGTT